jgi:hypothetical protein
MKSSRFHELLLLLALPLLLAAKLDDVESFQRAQQLYGELEFEQAIFALEEAALTEGLDAADRARVFAWLGLCHYQVRRQDEADRYFTMAVRSDAAVALPSFAPPPVVAKLDELRAKAAAAPQASPPPEPDGATQAAATAPAPAEPPASDDVAAADTALPWHWIGGAGMGAAGALSVVAGGVLFALAVPEAETARSEGAFQDEAITAANTANVEIASGSVLVAAGVALAGGGVALALLPMLSE